MPARFELTMTFRTIAVIAAAISYVAVMAFWSSLSTGLDHDEHQFMASAYMVAEHNLHPYQDFPYFHMPNLVYVYALFFWLTDYPFLWARLFSALCATGIAAMIFLISRSLLPKGEEGARLMIATSASVLFTHSPLFTTGASQVWNHAPSTLCAVLAFIFHGQALRRSMSWRHFLLSGFCLGLAIGIRLTFAPLIISFLAVMFLSPDRARGRLWLGISAFGIGGVAANIPGAYFLATSPEQFLFGNLRYPVLNTLFRQQSDYERAMTLGGKMEFFFLEILLQPENLLIALVVVSSLLGAPLSRIRQAVVSQLDFALLFLLLPFVSISSFAPTPSQHQYFFAPLPFFVLAAPFALAYCWGADARRPRARVLLLAGVLSLALSALPKTAASFRPLLRPDSWFPVQLHRVSEEIASRVAASHGGGKVLTLTPIYAVEAKLPVYPQLVTGQFGWRISHLLSPDDRRRQSLVGPAEIESLFRKDPPIVILTTSEAKYLKEPLVQMAKKLRYRQRILSDGSSIWTAPP